MVMIKQTTLTCFTCQQTLLAVVERYSLEEHSKLTQFADGYCIEDKCGFEEGRTYGYGYIKRRVSL